MTNIHLNKKKGSKESPWACKKTKRAGKNRLERDITPGEFVKKRNRPYSSCLVGQVQNLVFNARAIRTFRKTGKTGY